MADIRCPMCGKSNPAGAATCQYCSAILPPSVEPPPLGESAADGDVPDWLSQLRGGDSSDSSLGSPLESSPQDEASEAELPDWLARIRPDAEEDASSIAQPGASEEGAPDWLQSISTPATGKELGDSTENTPSLEEWLRQLDNAEGQVPAASSSMPEPKTESVAPKGTGDLDNDAWLKSFQDWSADLGTGEVPGATASEQPAAAIGQEDVWFDSTPGQAVTGALDQDFTEWLADLPQELTPLPGEGAEPKAEIPDWLDDAAAGAAGVAAAAHVLGDQNEGLLSPQPIALPADDTGVPDWLSATPEQPAAGEEAVPDWFSTVSAETSTGESITSAGEESAPDWLSALSTEPSPGAAADAGEIAGAVPGEEGVPDWLSAIPMAGAAAVAASTLDHSSETPAQTAGPEEEDLDWLRSLGSSQIPEEAEVSEPVAAPEAAAAEIAPLEAIPAEPASGEIPAWVTAAVVGGAMAAGKREMAAPEPETPPASEVPDWLTSFGNEAVEGMPTEPASAGETPDWLSSFAVEEAAADGTVPAGQAGQTAASPEGEKDSQWGALIGGLAAGAVVAGVAHQDAEQPALDAQPGMAPFVGEELPAWMDESVVPAEAAEGAAALEPTPLDEELVPAQMPGWLQAMRPVEAAVVASSLVEEGPTEKVGPLAGLAGALPIVDLRRQYRKPPVYSMKLKVTEKQRAEADLLREMLETEGEPQLVSTSKTQAPQRILRLVLGLILISILVITAVFTTGVPPSMTPLPEVSAVNDRVEALAAGSAVLLVADYEPGYSGEIDFAAYGLVERLMQKKARLAVVSTLPSGPVLGEDLLTRALATLSQSPAGSDGYTLGTWTANLGYLPGGIVSLQEFARSPQQAARYGFTSDISGQSVWDQPALQGVKNLSDFAMVVVLTSNPDNGRAWVEQVLPSLGASPLIFVGSAQSGPMLRPYVNQNQAAGLISGYTGGMTYLQLAKISVDHAYKWYVAYRAGLLMGVVFILLGLFYQVIVFLGSQRKA